MLLVAPIHVSPAGPITFGGHDPPPMHSSMMEFLAKQTDVLSKVVATVNAPKETGQLRSSIRIAPQVDWPKLGDDPSARGREVEEFYEKFEGTVGLANDGAGMTEKECLITL